MFFGKQLIIKRSDRRAVGRNAGVVWDRAVLQNSIWTDLDVVAERAVGQYRPIADDAFFADYRTALKVHTTFQKSIPAHRRGGGDGDCCR